jgi:hypothetical protein
VERFRGGGGLELLVDAADGARIVSLTGGGREWLAPSSSRLPGAFVQAGSGGWDEAVPTVAACVLPDRTVLPDHGDAWSSAWTVVSRGSVLETSVVLASLPVSLTRRVSATAAGIRLDYLATTASSEPLPLLWAAHPLFAADEDTRVVLDGSPALVEEYPSRGRPLLWDAGRAASGGALKAFATGTHASARVVHGDGAVLRLSWDPVELPHLGLYWDAQEFTGTPVVAIEPSTGLGDSAADALAAGAVRMLGRHDPLRWWLEVGRA